MNFKLYRKNMTIAHYFFSDEEWRMVPEKAKNYISDMEQRVDRSGEIRTIASLMEQRDGLIKKVKELEAKLTRKEHGKRRRNISHRYRRAH